MKTFMIALALALASAGASAQSPARVTPPAAAQKQATYTAVGMVKSIDPRVWTVMLAHDPIKALDMPAATTSFKLGDKALLEKIAPNRKMEFGFERQGAQLVIVSIRKLA